MLLCKLSLWAFYVTLTVLFNKKLELIKYFLDQWYLSCIATHILKVINLSTEKLDLVLIVMIKDFFGVLIQLIIKILLSVRKLFTVTFVSLFTANKSVIQSC